jgi:hypothetical protein
MYDRILCDDCLSSMHRHFEKMGAPQISHRYSDQTAIRGNPKVRGVLRESDYIIGHPCVACYPQIGATYFPQLQAAAASLRTRCEDSWFGRMHEQCLYWRRCLDCAKEMDLHLAAIPERGANFID